MAIKEVLMIKLSWTVDGNFFGCMCSYVYVYVCVGWEIKMGEFTLILLYLDYDIIGLGGGERG